MLRLWAGLGGRIGDACDNSVAESLFHTPQLELLDEHHGTSREQLATVLFDWIECWYNPSRRLSSIDMLSLNRVRSRAHRRRRWAMITTTTMSVLAGKDQGQSSPGGDTKSILASDAVTATSPRGGLPLWTCGPEGQCVPRCTMSSAFVEGWRENGGVYCGSGHR